MAKVIEHEFVPHRLFAGVCDICALPSASHPKPVEEDDTRDYITVRHKTHVALVERMYYSKVADSYQVKEQLKVTPQNAIAVAKRWAEKEGLEFRR